jgi:hypothetical protein
VGVTRHTIACGADKEIKIRARVGLLYVVDVEAFPAAYRIGEACEGGVVGSAALQLFVGYL